MTYGLILMLKIKTDFMHNNIVYIKNMRNCFLAFALILLGILPLHAQEDIIEIDGQVAPADSVEIINLLYRTIDKRDFLGSAATVYSKQISSTLNSNIIAPLQGRMAGLYISQYSGINPSYTDAISSSFGILVQEPSKGLLPDNNGMFGMSSRGQGVIIIVDGVQRDFTSVDPESIESISIQKDALSGIMLGGRSSRSVLIITTKEPVKKGFEISFTGKYGIQKPLNLPEPLPAYKYAFLLNEAFTNEGRSPVYSFEDFEGYRTGSNPYLYPDVNWYEKLLNSSSPIQSYNLNATGGSKNVQYSVNLGYFREDGLFTTDPVYTYNTNYSYDRYLITSKLNVKVTDKLRVGATLLGRVEGGNQPGDGMSSVLSSMYRTTANNSYPIYNPDGTFGGNQSYQVNLYASAMHSGYRPSNSKDGMSQINLDYDLSDLLKGLSISAQGNISTQSKTVISRAKQSVVFSYKKDESGNFVYSSYGSSVPQGNSFNSVSNAQQMYGQVALNYKSNFGKHEVGAVALGDFQDLIVNYTLPRQFANVNGRLDYNFDKKYFAEAAVSRGYYNRYAPDKRWGTFYAAGLGWDVSREEFLSSAKWLDLFKIRGVYGNTGNAGGSEASNYFVWREGFVGGNRNSYGAYTFGYSGGTVDVTREDNYRFVNKNMTYERANKLNIGTDISVFNNMIQLTADFYHDDYYDLLQTRGKSILLGGLSYPAENIGKVWVEGAELAITYQDRIGKFNYFITANWTRQTSKLVFMDEQEQPYDYLYRTGNPSGTWYGLICDGFFQSQEEIDNSAVIPGQVIRPGDLKYRDIPNQRDANGNLVGDGVIDQNDVVPIGGNKPLKYFGLNLGFEYRGFDFSMLWQGVYDRDIYLQDAGVAYISGFPQVNQGYGQAYEHLMGRWTPETAETATFPRLSPGGNAYNNSPLNGTMNSFWVRSGNYIRLRNISAGYTIPDSFSRNYLGNVKVKIFATGQNVFTKAACDFVDPEVLSFTSYPLLQTFSLGINVKF